ncbi:galactosylceramide sulfotransferase-like [Dendronephthya gigantea]|uniref:galactosylceramide sulfotransferase-like n=1 Tax=Dendronephthya gigantea TaxID=151771 RepID=UPI00106D679F|nr:galactosylceramide sulfotransferase-like [Dendronephthya gigantea]
MILRKRGIRVCIMAALVVIIVCIVSKIFNKNTLKDESVDFKLSKKRSIQKDLTSFAKENDTEIAVNKDLPKRHERPKMELSGSVDFLRRNEDTYKRSCKKHEVVVFIKTHKTGSSTITNILNRFADMNDVKVALPMGYFLRFYWPALFHWSAVDLWRLDGDTPSILSNHARYNRPTMQLIMRKGAKYITILRDPVDQYESTFNYMGFEKFLDLKDSKNPLADFLKNPVPKLYQLRDKHHGIPEPMQLVKNPMFFDLGMYPPAYNNMTRVRNEIKKLDRDFELVLIMEYFDESLLVLKKAFCWTMSDILYVKFNQRRHKSAYHRDEQVKKNIRYWNKADVILYEHFNRTLWKKIADYGPSFRKDLDKFRQMNSKMQASCVEKRQFTENAFNSSGDILSFRLNPEVRSYDRYFCMKMLRNEVDYIDYFRNKYKPRGSYQTLLEKEGKKRPSTRELIERLQIAANIKFAEPPRAVTS